MEKICSGVDEIAYILDIWLILSTHSNDLICLRKLFTQELTFPSSQGFTTSGVRVVADSNPVTPTSLPNFFQSS